MVRLMLSRALTVAALCTGLVTLCLFPGPSTEITIVAQSVALLVCFPMSDWRGWLGRPVVGLPLLAGVILLVAFIITAKSPDYLFGVLIIAPCYLIGPLMEAFKRSRWPIRPGLIGGLATLGAGVAMLVALYDVFVLHEPRGGAVVANPIHFADAALAMGSLGVLTLFERGRWRWLGLLGLVFSLVAIAASGTRGAMVAVVPALLVGIAEAAYWGKLVRRQWAPVAAGLIAILLVVGLAYVAGWSPLVRIEGTAATLIEGGTVTDASDSQRVLMYRGALNAFLQSPIFGHGTVGFTRIAAETLPADLHAPIYDHLHNDIADFAVVAGTIGLVAYLLLLAAPLVTAWRSRGPNRHPAILAASLLTIEFFAMGLTNATFGIILLTTFYAFGAALVGHLAASGEPTEATAS